MALPASRREGWLLAALPLLFLLAFLGLPLLRVLMTGGLSLGVWREGYFQGRLAWTLEQAGLTAGLALLIGGPLAYLLSRYRLPGKGMLLRLLLLPFVTPTLVAALGLRSLFGPRGLSGLDLSDTPLLLILGNLFFNLPLVIRLGHAGFSRLPPDLLGAARTLGASGPRAALGVALPLALPGLAAGGVLVFLYSLLSFGLPLLLGGERYSTIEVEIYTLTALDLRLSEASALILGQLGVTLAATLLYLRLRGGAAGVPRSRPLPRPRGVAAALLYGLLGLTLLLCFGPLLGVAVRSLTGTGGLTLGFWRGLLDQGADPSLGLMLGNTLRFGLLALCAALPLGSLHALGAWRAGSRELGRLSVPLPWNSTPSPPLPTAPTRLSLALLGHKSYEAFMANVLDLLSLLPLMVSPVSLAVGYLLLYPSLRASLPLLIAAYALLAFPLVTRSLLPALRAIPAGVLEAARTLGAGRGKALRGVVLPLVWPALRGGAALGLATVLGEFAATLVLTRPEWSTLSTGMYERLGRPGGQNLGEACALATLLMLLALLSFSVLDGGRGEVT